MSTITFDIRHNGDPDTKTAPYSDLVTVEVASGDLGPEFEQHIGDALADWFPGATVISRHPVAVK